MNKKTAFFFKQKNQDMNTFMKKLLNAVLPDPAPSDIPSDESLWQAETKPFCAKFETRIDGDYIYDGTTEHRLSDND
ncbi:hypothetical protein OQ483_02080 [Enterobacter bugandensis]|uniref:hypothetical protein n=1 Tax=Enterobacter bugandensis TaxID=881260 RepID=UPI00283A92BA|nr:hypothetical protein [Enterobacter bugandensis]WMU73253.1 hypothetical protein OQ483_02080 [Enterobacter bugandensis]